MNSPTLLFEFADDNGNKQPMMFTDPITIFTTKEIAQVVPILKKVEEAVEQGNYVAGFLSYEAAPAFEPLFQVKEQTDLPLIWFAVFDQPTPIKSEQPLENYHVSKWKPTTDFSTYQAGISAIKAAIKRGDTYQVNYTMRLTATLTGDDFSFYRQLAINQQASYSAYINIGAHRILSASPELFFRVNDGKIVTKPMKGTMNRGRTLIEDQQNQAYLAASEKERAENLMIVDLLRNDIGKIAESGSVQVPELLTIEKYPTVHQMTSTITANLKADTGLTDWMQALFPCGSITGAPKIKTMAYIDQLEDAARGVYCGAIGYMTPSKEAVFSVPIRTVLVNRKTNKATYGVGGGITWDSTTTNEYEEIATKARLLTTKRKVFSLLESLLLTDQSYPLLDYHMDRLHDSADYFDYPFEREEVVSALEKLASEFPSGHYKVRVLLDQNGKLSLDKKVRVNPTEPVLCFLALEPIDSNSPMLYHKTSDRSVYQSCEIDHPNNFSTLLWNERGQVTEFTIGNIVVERDGLYYTPPISSGLLPGTYRKSLLDQGKIIEQTIMLEELEGVEKIWLINSVRGWIEVQLSSSSAAVFSEKTN